MPYVLSTALVLILAGSRQAHIRLCDLCTPHPTVLPTPLCLHWVVELGSGPQSVLVDQQRTRMVVRMFLPLCVSSDDGEFVSVGVCHV